jgi:hypothetical protein
MGLFSKKGTADPSIPATTEKVPLVPFKVLEVGIPFYRDQTCSDRIEDATLMVIQALDPDDEIQEFELVPTTKRYQPGDYVNMLLDNKKLWEDCYYRDSRSGEIQKAWRIHVNFIGEVIAPEALAKDRQRVQELEVRVKEKIEEIARRSREDTPLH